MGAFKKHGSYQFKASADLFEQWRRIERNVNLLAGMVQNDQEGSGEDLEGWVKATSILQQDLKEIIIATQKHIAATAKEVKREEGNKRYQIAYEDSDGEIKKAMVTTEEYNKFLEAEDAGAIEILKHPKFTT